MQQNVNFELKEKNKLFRTLKELLLIDSNDINKAAYLMEI